MHAMHAKRSLPVVITYVLSLLATTALLVAWVVYIVRSSSRIEQLAGRLGTGSGGLGDERVNWWLLGIGCALFLLVIGGITYQLAQALAARRYLVKQDEFISNITHELKSPLAAIRLHAQTLEQPGLDAEDRRRSTRFIVQQTERMGILVDNVLESSRLLLRRARLEVEPVVLGPYLHRYLEREGPRVEARGVRLAPRIETGATVEASPDALQRVLDNLLDNAARFSDPGGEVRLFARDRGDSVELEVEDDGVGIPRSELKRVFERFYQVGRSGEGRRVGTGLGLSIVYGLVREMGGEVHAHSQEGRPGARFTVRLPRSREAAA
jgi:signal transduction histidine kinase